MLSTLLESEIGEPLIQRWPFIIIIMICITVFVVLQANASHYAHIMPKNHGKAKHQKILY